MQLITVTNYKQRISKGEKLNLVDVREPSEHDEFNIGGELIPLGNIQAMDVESTRSAERSGTDLLLPQWEQKRPGLSDSGNDGIYEYKKSAGRDACLAERV